MSEQNPSNPSRRRLLEAAGAGVLAATLGNTAQAGADDKPIAGKKNLRWGIVGTGYIAGLMAPRIHEAEGAELAAVSSRKMETAKEFATEYNVPDTFDSWQEMIASDKVDAVYLATPTSVREEIAIAAANQGKHVLGEKPFANRASLQRIIAACRENGVGFMDGTHFPHLVRTQKIRENMSTMAGEPWSLDSAFQFGLGNTNNIRLNPKFEPYGAIGDAGWYNMRAAVEFMPDDVELVAADTWMKRHEETGACICGSGVLRFSDGSTSTWNCGFNSGAMVEELRISGDEGVIWIDDFVFIPDTPADERIRYHKGQEKFEDVIPFTKQAPTLMFEDFTRMVNDPALFEAGVRASLRTQEWLDAAWESALANEQNNKK